MFQCFVVKPYFGRVKKITIAIDGFSSCGKSTLAKQLARELGYIYIDSGAMYRAVTLYFLRNGIKVEEENKVARALDNIEIAFSADNYVMLNGEEVERDIRQMEVSNYVSEVAAVPAVRRAMVAQQQTMGQARGIVMDGRDIGTVVFPDAELKIFLTASPDERARRRYQELLDRGEDITLEAVATNLRHRDRIDSTRDDSPLMQAEDAVVLDNTELDRATQLAQMVALARERMSK